MESFQIIKGGPDDLTDQLKGKIIGFVQNKTGFSGLVPVAETKRLPKEIITETPSIDEILVSISKGSVNHE
jgi:ABC-2 type transport system ATP-binding protein